MNHKQPSARINAILTRLADKIKNECPFFENSFDFVQEYNGRFYADNKSGELTPVVLRDCDGAYFYLRLADALNATPQSFSVCVGAYQFQTTVVFVAFVPKADLFALEEKLTNTFMRIGLSEQLTINQIELNHQKILRLEQELSEGEDAPDLKTFQLIRYELDLVFLKGYNSCLEGVCDDVLC